MNRIEDPNFIKLLKVLFAISLGLFVVLGFFVETHPHFKWEVPPFFALYGFVVCLLLILGSRALSYLILREDDYYD